MRAGDVGGGRAPWVRACEVLAPVLRAIVQARNIAVRGAAVRALLDDANEIACRVRNPFGVAPFGGTEAIGVQSQVPLRVRIFGCARFVISRSPVQVGSPAPVGIVKDGLTRLDALDKMLGAATVDQMSAQAAAKELGGATCGA